jgi:hypothetical protein
MRGAWAGRFGAALLVATCGCHGHGERDRMESELHARELQLYEMKDALACTRAHNQALQMELHTMRGAGCVVGVPPGVVPPPPVYPVRCLTLGRQTGGHPADHCAGDDALQVQVEPRDAENQAVKVPGSALLVQALEITPEGLKRPLSTWEVSPEELSCSWRSGLLSTGYSLTLPWKVWPGSDRLRVVAQLRVADGRVFEADKDVTVHVAPGAHPPPAPTPAPAPVPAPSPAAPVPVPVLPAPKPLAPSPSEGPVLPPGTAAAPAWHAPAPEPAVEILRPVALDKNR